MSAQINRRSLLDAPAFGLAGLMAGDVDAAVATVLPEATLIMALFREWNDQRLWIDGPGTDDMSDAEFIALCRQNDQVLDRMMALPAQTATEFAAQMIAVTQNGGHELSDMDAGRRFMAEARVMVGGAA